MAADYWESYTQPAYGPLVDPAAYARYGFGPAGGGFADLVAGFAPIIAPFSSVAAAVLPAFAEAVPAVRPFISIGGKIVANGFGFEGFPDTGEFPVDYPPTNGGGDVPWGSGGPDINIPSGGALDLGTIVSTVGGLAGASQGGGMIPTGAAGAAVAVGGLALRGMSQIVAGAILKLKQTLGGGGFLTAGGIGAFGARTWAALTGWATRNPGLSVISTLVGLGLTVEEAAHFLAWGAVHKRRRRHRGISYRDMRTTRRTMSRVISMSHQLRALCGAVPHRSYSRHRHAVVNLPRRR